MTAQSDLDPVQKKVIGSLTEEITGRLLESAFAGGIGGYMVAVGQETIEEMSGKVDEVVREHLGTEDSLELSLGMFFLGASKMATRLAFVLSEQGITSIDELDKLIAEEVYDESEEG